MWFESKDFLQKLIKLIKDLIISDTKNCIRAKVAKVISADNVAKTATIRFPQSPVDGSEDLAGLKNKSGEDLSAGDEVYIHYYLNNLSNAYIAIKK